MIIIKKAHYTNTYFIHTIQIQSLIDTGRIRGRTIF